MDATNYILVRIYQEDGREIEYVSRMKTAPAKPSKTWIWSVNWDEDDMCNNFSQINLNITLEKHTVSYNFFVLYDIILFTETEEAEVEEETNTTTAYNNHASHLVGEIEG